MFDPLDHYTRCIIGLMTIVGIKGKSPDGLRDAIQEALKQDSEEHLKAALTSRELAYSYHSQASSVRIEMMLYQNSVERRKNWENLPRVEVFSCGQTIVGRVIETLDDGFSIEFEDEVAIKTGEVWPSHHGCMGGLFKREDVTFL